jgi:hypothetical protein
MRITSRKSKIWFQYALGWSAAGGTADYNDVREKIKFENQNSIPHCPAPFILSVSHISTYDFPIS